MRTETGGIWKAFEKEGFVFFFTLIIRPDWLNMFNDNIEIETITEKSFSLN